ncbi:MAG: hypothetical protein IKR04_05440 [Clostridia bacterium]|nr:hypothetical protein [Clostridia bacterium]
MDNNQQAPQGQKKKSNIGIIILIVLVCLLPVIALIRVMLMSLGVLLFNQASINADNELSGMLQQYMLTFNAKYETFLGEEKKSSDVSQLMSLVRLNNVDVTETQKIVLNITFKDGHSYTIDEIYNGGPQLSSSSTYDVSAEYGKDGYINIINIFEK